MVGVNRCVGQAGKVAATVAIVALGAGVLGGCTIAVPVAPPSESTRATAPPSYAAPTVQAGHDAAAVAAQNMGFEAGTTLSPNIAVGFSDILGQADNAYDVAPVPAEWTLVKNNVAGQTQYANAAGCKVAYWVSANQGPLITSGDDRASSADLMKYLIPSLVPDSLKETSLPWVAEAGKPGPVITFLGYGTRSAAGVDASSVWGRMLGTAGTGLLVSLACPTDELLATTTPRVFTKLSVAPPSN